MYLNGFWLVEFQKMLSFETNPDVDAGSTQRSNSFVVSPLFTATQFVSWVFGEVPSIENPSLKFPHATSFKWRVPLAPTWSNPWSPLLQLTLSYDRLSFELDCRCWPVSWLWCQRLRRIVLLPEP